MIFCIKARLVFKFIAKLQENEETIVKDNLFFGNSQFQCELFAQTCTHKRGFFLSTKVVIIVGCRLL